MPIEEAGHKPKGRVYIKELAQVIDRTPHTIRVWQSTGALPHSCRPRRDSRGWRFWTPQQVDLIVAWIERRRPQPPEKLVKMRARRGEDN